MTQNSQSDKNENLGYENLRWVKHLKENFNCNFISGGCDPKKTLDK